MSIDYVNINQSEDMIIDTSKVTKGYFSGDIGTLTGGNLTTSSIADSNEEYYVNLQYSSADHFSVAYGDLQGSGSSDATTTEPGQTKSVYKQFAGLLLNPNEVSGGFVFSGSSTPDRDLFFVVAKRARMLDRPNKKNWTFQLSGSLTNGTQSTLYLTDDSDTVTLESTVAGPRYNIVSGTLGGVNTAYTAKTYGWFYPNMGAWVLRGSELSASLPGTTGYVDSGSWSDGAGVGFAPDRGNDGTAYNSVKLAKSFSLGSQTLRNEEDQNTISYFCRAKAGQFNFSTNPTFTSGSENRLQNTDMEGNTQTFISSIGLYDSSNSLVAVGRLSTPVKKNYGTEATIKVNLTY